MDKLVQLKLAKIKYGGDSVGEDIRIEIECLNRSFALDKRIKNGTEITIDEELGQFPVIQTPLTIPVHIKIIEQDLIFNDIGEKQVKNKSRRERCIFANEHPRNSSKGATRFFARQRNCNFFRHHRDTSVGYDFICGI